MENLEKDYRPIGDSVEGFSADEYLNTLSCSTIFADENVELDDKYLYNNTPILNQGKLPSCTVSGLTKSENEAEFFDNRIIRNHLELWKYAANNGYTNYDDGWSMSGALGLFKDLGYISGYYICHSPEEGQKALSKKHILYCGTRRCNRFATNKYNKFVKADGSRTGHAFACVGIDMKKGVYIFANSRGEGRGDNGLFTATFEEVKKYFYTMVAIIDKNDKPLNEDIADSNNMVDLGIWNGKLPNEALVKTHAIFMVMRAFKEEFDNDKAIQKALEEGIVSNATGPLTRRYYLYMIYRCITEVKEGDEKHIPDLAVEQGIIRTLNGLDEPITRYHASLIIARVFKMIRNR